MGNGLWCNPTTATHYPYKFWTSPSKVFPFHHIYQNKYFSEILSPPPFICKLRARIIHPHILNTYHSDYLTCNRIQNKFVDVANQVHLNSYITAHSMVCLEVQWMKAVLLTQAELYPIAFSQSLPVFKLHPNRTLTLGVYKSHFKRVLVLDIM